MKVTQKDVYNWLLQNQGEHRIEQIATGLRATKAQVSNACSRLRYKNAVANKGNQGVHTTWFAIPGADIEDGAGNNKTGAQALVYEWLSKNPGAEFSSAEISDACGIAVPTAGSACVNLKRKGAAILIGAGVYARWRGVPDVDIGSRNVLVSTGPRKSPGAVALVKFEKALEAFIDAAVEIKDYVVVEDQKAELEELRAFKTSITQAMRVR